MDHYIHDENLRLYQKVLADTTEISKRKMLLDLIRDEMAKPSGQRTVESPTRAGP